MQDKIKLNKAEHQLPKMVVFTIFKSPYASKERMYQGPIRLKAARRHCHYHAGISDEFYQKNSIRIKQFKKAKSLKQIL